jgi:hypothetical protein
VRKLSLLLMAYMLSMLAFAQTETKVQSGAPLFFGADQAVSDRISTNLADTEDVDAVMFRGNIYCLGVGDCRAFATWGSGNAISAGYVVLTEPDGITPSDYIWVDINGNLWFESDNESGGFAVLPPVYLRKLGTLVENGNLQEVDQYFGASAGRSLFIQSSPAERATPEPLTLLMVGSGAVLLFSRTRRFWLARAFHSK